MEEVAYMYLRRCVCAINNVMLVFFHLPLQWLKQSLGLCLVMEHLLCLNLLAVMGLRIAYWTAQMESLVVNFQTSAVNVVVVLVFSVFQVSLRAVCAHCTEYSILKGTNFLVVVVHTLSRHAIFKPARNE